MSKIGFVASEVSLLEAGAEVFDRGLLKVHSTSAANRTARGRSLCNFVDEDFFRDEPTAIFREQDSFHIRAINVAKLHTLYVAALRVNRKLSFREDSTNYNNISFIIIKNSLFHENFSLVAMTEPLT